jgi:hypothetical protein
MIALEWKTLQLTLRVPSISLVRADAETEWSPYNVPIFRRRPRLITGEISSDSQLMRRRVCGVYQYRALTAEEHKAGADDLLDRAY